MAHRACLVCHDPSRSRSVRSGSHGNSARRGPQTAAIILALLMVLAGCSGVRSAGRPSDRPATTAAAHAAISIVTPLPVTDDELRTLPEATTFATLAAAPRDPAPTQPLSGRVLHPTKVVPVYAAPGGRALAALPPTQLTSDTWLPVIAEQPGWAHVLLPSRPNGATAWLVINDAITSAVTPFEIRVDRSSFQLRLLRGRNQVGVWTVGVGKPTAPTPTGRTFLLADIREQHPTYSPIVLPLGAHSDTHLTYGGGPGTVGLHGWPTTDVFGRPSSDGCVRIPSDALQLISAEVPLGTPVLVS